MTFDLDLKKINNGPSRPMSMPKIKVLGPTVAEGEAGTDRQTDRQTDGNVGNIYGFFSWLSKTSKKKLVLLFLLPAPFVATQGH